MDESSIAARWTELDPTPRQIAALRAHAHRGDAYMLNLIRFRDRTADGAMSGRDAYRHYAEAVEPMIARWGGRLAFVGRVNLVAIGHETDDRFDQMMLVQYPAFATMCDMMESAEYRAINPWRLAGLERHVLLALTDVGTRRG